MGCLYKLTSPSGKSYIGITNKTFEKRWLKHIEQAKQNREGALYNAIRKYGHENFTKEILKESEIWTDLCKLEQEKIKEMNTMYPNGYNLTIGGEGVQGRFVSEESRIRMSLAQKKRFQNPEQRQKMSEYAKIAGQKISLKYQKIREEKAIEKIKYRASIEYKEKRSNAIKLAMSNPETKKKMSLAAKKRASDPEWKRKISESKVGKKTRPCSEERKRKISEARKREWADPVLREKRLKILEEARNIKHEKQKTS